MLLRRNRSIRTIDQINTIIVGTFGVIGPIRTIILGEIFSHLRVGIVDTGTSDSVRRVISLIIVNNGTGIVMVVIFSGGIIVTTRVIITSSDRIRSWRKEITTRESRRTIINTTTTNTTTIFGLKLTKIIRIIIIS